MKKKVGVFHSIKWRLSLLVTLAIIVTGLLMVVTYSPNVKKELSTMSQHYLNDLAMAYGVQLEDDINSFGLEEALNESHLTEHLDEVGLQGIDSSYVYVVSSNAS